MTQRRFVEPVAEFLNVVGGIPAGQFRESWRLAADPNQMPVNHWVDCEGLDKLRILALGAGAANGPDISDFFYVTVFTYAESPYVTGAIPPFPFHCNRFVFASQNISADPVPMLQDLDQVVSETVDLGGAKSVGIRVDIDTKLAQPDFQLRAFLL